MSFSPEERAALLKVKGVGPTVVGRLEQLGIISLSQLAAADEAQANTPRHWSLPVVFGALIGTLVTLTSVGAGAIGVTVLLLLYPMLPLPRIVAADIAYAVPLTLVAGLGHASLGSVDWPLLAKLLAGSLPGIWLGARLTHHTPDRVIRALLALAVGLLLQLFMRWSPQLLVWMQIAPEVQAPATAFLHAISWGAPALAGLVAWSRIAVGVHFPLDVAAGLAVGSAAAWTVHRLRRRSIWPAVVAPACENAPLLVVALSEPPTVRPAIVTSPLATAARLPARPVGVVWSASVNAE